VTERESRTNPFSIWESVTVESCLDNPSMIEVLHATTVTAAAVLSDERERFDDLSRQLARTRQQVAKAQQQLAKAQLQTSVPQRSIARLEERLSARESELAELGRRARISVVIAWVGTVLVAAGINYLTDGEQGALGWILLLGGAAVEVCAFFVSGSQPRRESPPRDESDTLADQDAG